MDYKQKKYVFVKPYHTKEGTIPEGSEIIIFRDTVYFNGGMVHPAYQMVLKNIVEDQNIKGQYLKEVSIINNKI